jgi:hypothetical protein
VPALASIEAFEKAVIATAAGEEVIRPKQAEEEKKGLPKMVIVAAAAGAGVLVLVGVASWKWSSARKQRRQNQLSSPVTHQQTINNALANVPEPEYNSPSYTQHVV